MVNKGYKDNQKLHKQIMFLSSVWSKGPPDPSHVDFHAFSDFHAWYFHSFSEVRRGLGLDFDGQHIYMLNIYTMYIEHRYVKKHSVIQKMDLYMVFLLTSGLKID